MTGFELVLAVIVCACLATVGYVYFGYPVLIWAFSRLFGRPPAPPRIDTADLPVVTLLIVAHNEEVDIRGRIENALALNYPRDRFEIAIASDGSTDGTNAAVREYAGRGVVLFEFPTNRGKAAALNDAIGRVRGDIVVLSDANTVMAPDAARRLAEWFADPTVGVVCGKLVLVDPATGQNVDGLYWKYETFLKKCESRLGALLGTNGANYAIRRSLFPGGTGGLLIDDFVIPLTARMRTGCRLQYDHLAVAAEETPARLGSEFRRRVRIGAGGYQALGVLWPLLDPRQGWIAFTFLSHKLLRWVCPFLLLVALAGNVTLAGDPAFRVLLALQAAFYASALGAAGLPRRPRFMRIFRLGTMFVMMNAALLAGFVQWAVGPRTGAWRRTPRVAPPRAGARP